MVVANILLLASFFILMAVVLEAKVRARLGFFIASTSFIVAILNALYLIAQMV